MTTPDADLEFVPTSTHRNWKGKVKCLWCGRQGWPQGGQRWQRKHGVNCAERPSKAEATDTRWPCRICKTTLVPVGTHACEVCE